MKMTTTMIKFLIKIVILRFLNLNMYQYTNKNVIPRGHFHLATISKTIYIYTKQIPISEIFRGGGVFHSVEKQRLKKCTTGVNPLIFSRTNNAQLTLNDTN